MISKSVTKRMKELTKEIDKLRSELTKESKKSFKAGIKQLFDSYKSLNSFAWAQYTPYFNDGDECVFGAYTESIHINEENDETGLWYAEKLMNDIKNKNKVIKRLEQEISEIKKSNDNWRKYIIEQNNDYIELLNETSLEDATNRRNMINDIVTFLTSFDDDTLKDMFGDHVMVTVTRSGIDTESYSHD